MLGDIHLAVKYQIITGHGSSVWKVILERTRMDPDNDFLPYHYYDDKYTLALMEACAQIIGIPIERYLEQFGDSMVAYIQKNNHYCNYLATCFEKFLQSLETVCELLRLGKRGKAVTEFSLETTKAKKKMMLHFVTSIPWLIYIMFGFIKTIAIQQYKTYCEMKEETVSEVESKFGMPCKYFTISLQADIIAIKSWQEEIPVFRRSAKAIPMRLVSKMCPYYFVFGKSLEIKYCGTAISKLCHIVPLTKIDKYFTIVQPIMHTSFEDIAQFSKSIFTIEVKGVKCNFIVKGTMTVLRDNAHIMFIGSLILDGPDVLLHNQMDLEDVPFYTASSVLMMLREKLHQHKVDRSHLLATKQVELRKTVQEVDAKRAKQGCQLCKYLPPEVADALNKGEIIDSERFESVSLLYIQIDNFKMLCETHDATNVGELIRKLHQVIKEETSDAGAFLLCQNGDYFIVISGAPEKNYSHAEIVCNAALEIMLRSTSIKVPGLKSVQLKMGIHTGTVVSAVLDDKLPQYTLCGDTLMIAKEMAKAGIPGKIHLGPDTFRMLERALGFNFDRRGIVDLQSVCGIITFFLTGNPRRGVIPWLKWDPSEEDLMHQLQAESEMITMSSGFSCTIL